MRTRTRHRTGCAPPLSPSVWVLTCASAQIKERYPSTTPQQFMFYMNLWCSLYYTVYMFALTGVHAGAASRCIAPISNRATAGTGIEAIEFLGAYPEALEQVLLYCVGGAAGQARRTGTSIMPARSNTRARRTSSSCQSPASARWSTLRLRRQEKCAPLLANKHVLTRIATVLQRAVVGVLQQELAAPGPVGRRLIGVWGIDAANRSQEQATAKSCMRFIDLSGVCFHARALVGHNLVAAPVRHAKRDDHHLFVGSHVSHHSHAPIFAQGPPYRQFHALDACGAASGRRMGKYPPAERAPTACPRPSRCPSRRRSSAHGAGHGRPTAPRRTSLPGRLRGRGPVVTHSDR